MVSVCRSYEFSREQIGLSLCLAFGDTTFEWQLLTPPKQAHIHKHEPESFWESCSQYTPKKLSAILPEISLMNHSPEVLFLALPAKHEHIRSLIANNTLLAAYEKVPGPGPLMWINVQI